MLKTEKILWFKGHYVPLSRVFISPLDHGLLYGDGLFTTIRGQYGCPLYLERHIERLSISALALDLPEQLGQSGKLDWVKIIVGLLIRNDLVEKIARVKIVFTRGAVVGVDLLLGQYPTLFVSADFYQPPSEEEYMYGWRLCLTNRGYIPPLASYKTLNYLYYLIVRREAQALGYHETVILSSEGELCETATSSFLIKSNGCWWTPKIFFQLPGVTLNQVRVIMAKWGYDVIEYSAYLDDFLKAETIWILNSLIGVMPVAIVGRSTLPDLQVKLAAKIRKELFKKK